MNSETIHITVTSDVSDLEKATQTTASFIETVEQIPGAMSDAVRSVNATSESFAHSNPIVDALSVLPQSLRASMVQMIDIAKYQNEHKTTALSTAKGNIQDADYTKASAILDATVHTVGHSLLRLNSIFSSASRMFGNNTNEFKSFGNSISSLQKHIAGVVDRNMDMLSNGGLSDAAIKQILLNDTGVKGGLSKTIASLSKHADYSKHADIINEKTILDAMIPAAISSMYRQDYWKYAASKSGGSLKKAHYSNYVKNYLDSFPEPFKRLPQDPRKMTAEQKASQHSYGDQLLNAEEWELVRKAAADNATFEAALINRGLAKRSVSGSGAASKAGSLLMPSTPISKQQLAEALGIAAQLNAEALEGAPAWRKNLSSRNGYDQENLANKMSRTPSDVRRLGRELESLGIHAVIPASTTKQAISDASDWTLAKKADGRRSIVSIRPDQYQIQALTFEDFTAGKTLPANGDSKYILNDDDDEYAGQRTSKYRFVSDSGLASFIGLRGHNTFGNGSKTDNSRPIVMSLDLTNGAMETDALDNQVWENGLPKFNAEHEQRLVQMYTHNASMDYVHAGKQEKYNYARMQLGQNGDYYVPINQKSNGTATMIREDVFLNRSRPMLEKYGVSPFDNFISQDHVYKNEEEFSKVTEARNRAMTDSVPLEALTDRKLTKSALDRFAIVDFGIFTEEKKKSLDGTSFAMPGLLPADAAVVRMGLSSVKGVAQQWDFHQYLKDLTGKEDLKEFYMVSSTASDDIKKFAKGFSATKNESLRAAFETSDKFKGLKFDDYFVNVMDMEWLLSDTMIKTPFLKQTGLTQSQLRERLGDIMFDDEGNAIPGMGLRFHKTDEGALVTDQSSLSQQLTRTLLFNDDELDARVQEHVTKINRLRNDPLYQMQHVFNDPNNPQHQAVNKNWSLTHYAPEARKAIEEAVAAEEKDFYQNRIKTHGNAAMALALMDPYLAFSGALSLNGVTEAKDMMHLTDDQIAFDALRLGQRNQQNLKTIAFRFPYTKGQHYKLNTEQRSKFMDQVARYGGSVNGVYVTPQAIAQMGGGDFDGDTLQLLFGDLATIAERNQNTYLQSEDKIKPESKTMNRAATAADMARLAFRSSVAPILMGGIERAQQILMEQDWDDPEMKELYSASARALADAYDIDSTYLKTGVAAEWTKEMNEARGMGTAFSKAFKHAFGAIQEGDFSKMDSFSDVNLPSIFSALTANAAAASRSTPFSGAQSRILAQQNDLKIAGVGKSVNELLQSTGENQLIDHALGEYYKHRNRMVSQHLTSGAVFSNDDIDKLRALGVQYNTEFAYAQKRLPSDSALMKAYDRRLKTIQNDLKQIDRVGLTEANVREGKGYARAFLGKNGELQLTQDLSEQSDFDAGVIEAQLVDWSARQAIATDDTMVAATRAAEVMSRDESETVKRQREMVRRGFSKAKERSGHGWSWSQIDKFYNDRNVWFDKYVQGNHEQFNSVATTIGSAYHKAAEMHLRQLAGEDIIGTYAGKSLSEIYDMFLEGKTQEGRDAGGQENFKRSNLHEEDKLRYDKSRHALSLIDDLFKDIGVAKVLGAEREVSPDFSPAGMDAWATGSTDALLQLADGALATLDWKPNQGKPDKAYEQANLYAHAIRRELLARDGENAVLPTKVIIAAHQDRDKKGHLKYQIFDYDEDQAQSTLASGRAAVLAADAAARIGQLENPDYWKNPELYAPMPFREDTEKPFSRSPDQDVEAWKNYNKSLAHQSGEEIAHAMAGYQEIHELSENALGLSRKYGSIARKAQMPEMPRNRWTDSKQQLEYMEKDQAEQQKKYNYDEKNPHVAQAQANINAAKLANDEALKVSATADLERFIKTMSQIPGTSKGLQAHLKQAEALKQAFENARAAYDELQNKVNEESAEAESNAKRSKELIAEREALRKEYESETDEDKRKELYAQMEAKKAEHAKLSSGVKHRANQQALEAAEKQKDTAQHDVQNRQAEINQRIVDETILNASSLYQQSSGHGLSISDRARLAVIKEKEAVDTAIADIDTLLSETDGVNTLFKEDLLSGDDARVQHAQKQLDALSSWRQSLLGIDYSKREQDITEQLQSEDRRRMVASTKRVDNLRTQGRRLDRSAWGRRGNGVLARSLYEWESGKDQYDNRKAALQAEIIREEAVLKEKHPDSEAYKIATKNLVGQKAQLAETERKAESFSSSMGAVAVTMNNVSESVGRVISQFGRQMFQKAMQEAKRFVQEYDAAMTEIQMITGKTDAEIATLGSGLIQTAIDMKVSVSDVTSAASDLYRQGLEDEDVDVRMEDVLKFAKVAKIKSEEASKIITTAQSNGLVESSGEAMDALVALGDSAATTASEIAKGMQKSAASAKQAGVSYKELVTMLTIITSKTQLGGNQAGTALQTLMYRLYRVNEGEDFYDENGNRIAANDASKALKQLGVNIYDDNGAPRGAYDIMVDVAKNWNDASNISQEMVLNALGAGRQRSNIATLIQGQAEDDGALADKYMKLVSESEGITDTKYLAYLDSLNAALTEVKSSFDQLIASFAVSEVATDFLSFISEFIQGLAAAEEASEVLSKTAVGLVSILGALAVASFAVRIAVGDLSAITNLAVGVGAIGALGILGAVSAYGNNRKEHQTPSVASISSDATSDASDYKQYKKIIDESHALVDKEVLTKDEILTQQSNLQLLSERFGTAALDLETAGTSIKNVATVIDDARRMLEEDYSRQVRSSSNDQQDLVFEAVVSNYHSVPAYKKQLAEMLGYSINWDSENNDYGYGMESGEAAPREYRRVSIRGDLSTSERRFHQFLTNGYYSDDELDLSTAKSDELTRNEKSEIFRKFLDRAVAEGIMTSSDSVYYSAFQDAGLATYGRDLVHDVMTAGSWNDFKNLNSASYSAQFETESQFETTQYQLTAAMYRYINDEFQKLLNAPDYAEELAAKDLNTVIDENVKPWLESISSIDEAKYTIEWLKDQASSQGIYSQEPVSVARWLNSQIQSIADWSINNLDKTLVDRLGDEYKPVYTVYDETGQAVASKLTQAEAQAMVQEREDKLNAYQASQEAYSEWNVGQRQAAADSLTYIEWSEKKQLFDYTSAQANKYNEKMSLESELRSAERELSSSLSDYDEAYQKQNVAQQKVSEAARRVNIAQSDVDARNQDVKTYYELLNKAEAQEQVGIPIFDQQTSFSETNWLHIISQASKYNKKAKLNLNEFGAMLYRSGPTAAIHSFMVQNDLNEPFMEDLLYAIFDESSYEASRLARIYEGLMNDETFESATASAGRFLRYTSEEDYENDLINVWRDDSSSRSQFMPSEDPLIAWDELEAFVTANGDIDALQWKLQNANKTLAVTAADYETASLELDEAIANVATMNGIVSEKRKNVADLNAKLEPYSDIMPIAISDDPGTAPVVADSPQADKPLLLPYPGHKYYVVKTATAEPGEADPAASPLDESIKEAALPWENDDTNKQERVARFIRYMNQNGIIVDDSIDWDRFTEHFNVHDYGDMTSLQKDVPDFAKALYEVTYKDNSGMRRVIDSKAVTTAAGRAAYSALLSQSSSYSDIIWDSSQVVENSNAILDKYKSGTEPTEDEYEQLRAVYGDAYVSKLQKASASWWDVDKEQAKLDADGNLREEQTSASIQDWMIQTKLANLLLPKDQQTALTWENYLAAAQEHNKWDGESGTIFSAQEADYYKMQGDNFALGIKGINQGQALTGVYDVLSAVQNRTLSTYMGQSPDMISAYQSQFSNQSSYMDLARIIESDAKASAAGLSLDDLASLESGDEGYSIIDNALQSMGSSAEQAKKIIEALNAEIASAENIYGDMTAEVLQNSAALKGNKREVANAHKNINQLLTTVSNNQYYRQQYKSGDRSTETIASITAQTGFDKEYVKSHADQVNKMLDMMMESDREEVQAQVSAFDQYLTQDVVDAIAVDMPEIKGVGGSVDFSEAIGRLSADSAAELQALADTLSQMGFTAAIVATEEGDSVKYKIVVSELAGMAGRKPSGGGGGGGKSAAEKLLEEQERDVKLWEHRRKMIQYEETRYQNAGELTNYSIMLGHESDEIERQIGLREQQLDELKKQMAATKEHSEDWYALRDAILSCEEALSELRNDYEELERTQEEVQQQIYKLHTDLESTVQSEIEARIQKERDMLSGRVSIEDTILEAIRERYRKEWELMQEDIDKKRKALQEEMNQIDELLQRRKDAEDEAAKYEELAELKRQLALIGMDGSRTKDQAKLREQIADLEKELAWDAAEDEAEAQKQSLQDKLDAYDSYESEYQKYLDDYLEDANNFADEVNTLLAGSQEDLFKWLKENVDEYSKSLDSAQEQMVISWQDTWKQMKGEVTTFWTEIAKALSSKDAFLEFMKGSDEYIHASEDEKKQLEYNWETMYDNWVSAKKKSEEAENYEHNDIGDGPGSGNSTNPAGYRTYYGGWQKKSDGTWGWVPGYGQGDTQWMADAVAASLMNSKGLINTDTSTEGYPSQTTNPNSSASSKPAQPQHKLGFTQIVANEEGGLIDFTGLTWVDGTKKNPEAFLSADDTRMIRKLLDTWHDTPDVLSNYGTSAIRAMVNSWTYSAVVPSISGINNGFGQSSMNIGDQNISINEASFAEDADYEEVARRVGVEFSKELSRQGFRISAFNY